MVGKLDSRQDPTARIRSSSSRPLTSAGNECPRAGPAPVIASDTLGTWGHLITRPEFGWGARIFNGRPRQRQRANNTTPGNLAR